MYNNLKSVIAIKKITQQTISELLEIGSKSVYNKLNGETDWSLPEAVKIKKYLFPEYDLDWLFLKETDKTA